MSYTLSDYLPVIALGAVILAVIVCVRMLSSWRKRRDGLRRTVYTYTAGRQWNGTTQELRRLIGFHGLLHITCVAVDYEAVGKIIDGTHDEDDVHDRIGRFIVHEQPEGHPEDTGNGWRFRYTKRR